MFETSLRGEPVHGLNVVELDPDGLVGELTVFFGPLTALQLISEVIGGPRTCMTSVITYKRTHR